MFEFMIFLGIALKKLKNWRCSQHKERERDLYMVKISLKVLKQ